MQLDYDPNKNQRNIAERGISFASAAAFDWDTAIIWQDTRKDYGEQRFIAMGMIADRLHALVFTPRGEDVIRVISLRKANSREAKLYESATKP